MSELRKNKNIIMYNTNKQLDTHTEPQLKYIK